MSRRLLIGLVGVILPVLWGSTGLAAWGLAATQAELASTLYYDLVVQGEILYAAGKNGVDLFDLSAPEHPSFLRHIPTQGIANGVAVRGDLLVVGDVYGLETWDCSDPSEPIRLGFFDAAGTGIYPERMVIREDLAYVASYAGMSVFDLSDPTNPYPLAYDPGQFYCYRLELTDQLAVLADVFDLLIYDISDPRVPTRIGQVAGLVFALELAVVDRLVYVPYVEGLDIFDLTDPRAPVWLGNGGETGSGAAEAVAVVGDTAYVAHGAYLDIYDVSDPTDPWQTSFMFTRASPRGILVHGDLLYMNEDAAGIEVVDISSPREPVSLNLISPPETGTRRSVEWFGDRLYLADGGHGVRIYDSQAAGVVSELTRLNTPGSAERLAMQDEILYVADRNALEIYDLTDPQAPIHLGQYRSTGQAYDVHVVGDRAVLTDFYGVILLDVSDPSQPTRLGAYFPSNEGTPYTGLPWGDLVLAGTGYGGLMVLDFSDPERPVRIAQVPEDNSRSYTDLHWIQPDILAAARASGGVDLIDLADPGAPQVIGSYEGADSTGGLDYQAPYLAFSDGDSGIKVVDVSRLDAPGLVGWSQTPGNGRSVAWSPDGNLFVADDTGFLGFVFTPEPDDTPPLLEILGPVEEDPAGGKNLTLHGRALDEGSGVDRVEIRLDGGDWQAALGRESWVAHLEPGVWDQVVLLEARAVDHAGNVGAPISLMPYYRPGAPRILMAGFGTSRVPGTGSLTIQAVVGDPHGSIHLGDQRPEIHIDGLPTGLFLEPDEEAETIPGELRSYSLELPWGSAPAGRLTVQIGIRDRFGNPSVLWPYLGVPER